MAADIRKRPTWYGLYAFAGHRTGVRNVLRRSDYSEGWCCRPNEGCGTQFRSIGGHLTPTKNTKAKTVGDVEEDGLGSLTLGGIFFPGEEDVTNSVFT